VKAAGYQITGNQLTAGSGVTESSDGYASTTKWKGTIDYSDVAALGAVTSGDITICTLPAKAIVHEAFIVVDTQGTFGDTLTISFGSAGAGYDQLVVASDAKAADNTIYGAAQDGSETGTDLDNAGSWYSIGKLYSYTTTQALKAHVNGNLTNLSGVSAGQWSFILVYEVLP
jgi:hypothetical protein